MDDRDRIIFDIFGIQDDQIAFVGGGVMNIAHQIAVIFRCAARGRYENRLASGPAIFQMIDRKSTRLNSSHDQISYAVFCLKKKTKKKKKKIHLLFILNLAFTVSYSRYSTKN